MVGEEEPGRDAGAAQRAAGGPRAKGQGTARSQPNQPHPLSRLGVSLRRASMTRVGLLRQSCWFTLMLFDDHVVGFRRHDLLYVSSLMPGPEDELS